MPKYENLNKANTPDSGNEGTEKSEKIEAVKEYLFDRETPEEYKPFIDNVGLIKLKEPYTRSLVQQFYTEYHDYPNNPSQGLSELGEVVSKGAENEVILDLGCGKTTFLSSFFRESDPKFYVGVDLNPNIITPVAYLKEDSIDSHSLMKMAKSYPVVDENSLYESEETVSQSNEPSYYLRDNIFEIQDDMLGAISRMKDNITGLIIVSGIERSNRNTEDTTRYLQALEEEITRTLKDDGLVLIYESDFSLPDFDLMQSSQNKEWKLFRKTTPITS